MAAGMLIAGAASAQTSVSLYGMVDDAITYVNNQNGAKNIYLRQGNLYASKWGLRGREDLGGGTAAIFDLQAGFDLNTGAASSAGLLFNRLSFVGLQHSSAGTLTLGRQYTPYYSFVGPLTGSNFLTGATGAHPGDIDGLDTTIRINNSVVYTTPAYAGLQASFMYALAGIAGSTGKGSTLSGALRYDNGPVSLGAAYLRLNNAARTAGFDPTSTGSFGTSVLNQGYVSARAIEQWAAAGTYTFGNLLVGANYSNVRYEPGANSIFANTAVFNTIGVLGVYKLTPVFDVGAGYSYTTASRANGISDSARYHQFSLREYYHLSKRTTLYALQAYQHANGQTLGKNGAGNIVAASPAVGDSQNLTGSSTSGQFVGMVGMAVVF
nr:porin [Pandoraea terrae]